MKHLQATERNSFSKLDLNLYFELKLIYLQVQLSLSHTILRAFPRINLNKTVLVLGSELYFFGGTVRTPGFGLLYVRTLSRQIFIEMW